MGIFHKTISISIKNCDPLVFVILSINGTPISKMTCVLQEDNSLLIGDIKPFTRKKYYNKGYGSMMMDNLLKYVVDNGINAVCGNLSVVDKDHAERLHHFYKKHGFEVVIFNKPKDMHYGRVLKKL